MEKIRRGEGAPSLPGLGARASQRLVLGRWIPLLSQRQRRNPLPPARPAAAPHSPGFPHRWFSMTTHLRA